MKTDKKTCNEALYQDYHLIGYCIQPHGQEHSHSDLTAIEAVKAGKARLVSWLTLPERGQS